MPAERRELVERVEEEIEELEGFELETEIKEEETEVEVSADYG